MAMGRRFFSGARFGLSVPFAVGAVAVAVTLPLGLAAGAASAAARGPGTARGGKSDSPSAGTSIGNAAQVTGTVSGTIVSGSDDWWVIYPKTSGGLVTVTVENDAATDVSCPIAANLDGTEGAADNLDSSEIRPSQTLTLEGAAAQSDRYYVEVDPYGCTAAAPYTLTLTAGGGGAPPDPASASAPAGASIGAWPPLRGHVSYAGSLGSSSSQHWSVLYKKADGSPATIRVEDTTVAGTTSCPDTYVWLDDTNGTADPPLESLELRDNEAVTFTVPGREPGDSEGRYFIEIEPYCEEGGSVGGTYSIEPEPAAQWASPARVRSVRPAPGTSARTAWPPLQGDLYYAGALGSPKSNDWFVLYKNADGSQATVRVEDTTAAGTTICPDTYVWLYSTYGTAEPPLESGELRDNGSVTFTVPGRETGDPRGRYFVEIEPYCEEGGSVAGTYSIEPEPASQWGSTVLRVADPTLRRGIVHRAYSAVIEVAGGKKPYSFAASTALPPGLSLNKRTGRITGKPAKAGTFTFAVDIRDSAKPVHHSYVAEFRVTIT
jgi:hypothetical protein